MTNTFLDEIDALLASPMGEVRQPVAAYQPKDFSERCTACKGSGQFRSYSGRLVGSCFKCKGAGNKTFKTSPEARTAAKARTVNKLAANIEAFKTANPDVFAWLQTNTNFEFAVSLNAKLHTYGDLTDGQLTAAKKCVATAAAKKAATIEAAPVADKAGIDRLKLAFDTAIAKASEKGLAMRTPKLTIGGIVISPAKATSANAGALYAKAGATYLGKIANGRFFASRECSETDEAKVLAFVADPKQAAEAYGQTTGTCCICNATLTSKWKLRGIGPVCATKFGW